MNARDNSEFVGTVLFVALVSSTTLVEAQVPGKAPTAKKTEPAPVAATKPPVVATNPTVAATKPPVVATNPTAAATNPPPTGASAAAPPTAGPVGAAPTVAPSAGTPAQPPASVLPVAEGPAAASNEVPSSQPMAPPAESAGNAGTAPVVATPPTSEVTVKSPLVGGYRILRTPAEAKAPPAEPKKTRYPLGLELSLMPVWQTSRGYDLFSANDVTLRAGIGADVEVGEVAEKTMLAIDAGWSVESQSKQSDPQNVGYPVGAMGTSELVPQSLEAKYVAHNLQGGVKLRYALLPFLAPHVRLSGGATSIKTQYDVGGSISAGAFESKDWLAFGMIGAGVTASLPSATTVLPGLTLEGGYVFSQSLPLQLEPKTGEQSIPIAGASLGTLERSGPYLKFGVFLRY